MVALCPARSLPRQGRGTVYEFGHGKQHVRADPELVTGLVEEQITAVRGARDAEELDAVFLPGRRLDLADLLPDRVAGNFLFVGWKAWMCAT
jgi:hypothetical protein